MFVDTLPKRPDRLIAMGYAREESPMDDWGGSTQRVRFRKRIHAPFDMADHMAGTDSQRERLVLDIVIEYELFISDDPEATWEQNCNYSFEEVRLVVWQRIEDEDSRDEDADARRPRLKKIGVRALRPTSLRMLEQFAAALGYTRPKPS